MHFFDKKAENEVLFLLAPFLLQMISYKRYSFNGDYLSIPKCTGSSGYLFHEIPGTLITFKKSFH